MSDMRHFLTLVEGLNEQIVDEATLYRGDSSQIDQFDVTKTDHSALFGKGIYLTDSPDVAGDYTVKASEHVVFSPDIRAGDQPAHSERDIVAMYLRHIMDTRLDRDDKIQAIKDSIWDRYWNKEFKNGENEARDVLTDELKKLTKDLMKAAKAIYKNEAPDLRLIQNTMGEFQIVKKDRTGFVTTFEVPDDYLAKCLDAEKPLPDLVLTAIKEMMTDGEPDRIMDMRDAREKFCTFDEWCKAYNTIGIAYAWRKGSDRIVKGKGTPSLDLIWNGTHMGHHLFSNPEFQNAFIAKMQALGYVGLEYEGGNRVGGHVRGLGGVKHHAYVFWDADALAHFRRESAPVSDPALKAGIESGIRSSRGLYAIGF
jgi:hypothetical protein